MYQRILVATDGSVGSDLAVREASRLAKDQGARLRIVHVVDLGPLYRAAGSGVPLRRIEESAIQHGEDELAHAAAIARQEGVDPETAALRSDGRRLSAEIVAEATRWPADLIVLGTHGRHGLERVVLGSVAEGVARAAPVPVLLVRRP